MALYGCPRFLLRSSLVSKRALPAIARPTKRTVPADRGTAAVCCVFLIDCTTAESGYKSLANQADDEVVVGFVEAEARQADVVRVVARAERPCRSRHVRRESRAVRRPGAARSGRCAVADTTPPTSRADSAPCGAAGAAGRPTRSGSYPIAYVRPSIVYSCFWVSASNGGSFRSGRERRSRKYPGGLAEGEDTDTAGGSFTSSYRRAVDLSRGPSRRRAGPVSAQPSKCEELHETGARPISLRLSILHAAFFAQVRRLGSSTQCGSFSHPTSIIAGFHD